MKLYLKSSGSGLSIVPKLKYEHVYLTSFSKMRVDLAAQVHTCMHAHVHVYLGVHYQEYSICVGDELNSSRGSTLNWRRGSQGNCKVHSACGQILRLS